MIKWWKARKARAKRAQFESGFCVAVTSVLLNGEPSYKLQALVEESRDFGEYDDFDRGVELGLGMCRQFREASGLRSLEADSPIL